MLLGCIAEEMPESAAQMLEEGLIGQIKLAMQTHTEDEEVQDAIFSPGQLLVDSLKQHAGMFHNIPMTLQENKTFAIKAVAANVQILKMIPVHLVEDPSFLVAVFQEPTTMVRLMEGLTSTNAGCVVWYFSVLHYVSACPWFGSTERLRQVLMRITFP